MSKGGNIVKVLNARYLIVFPLHEVLLSPTAYKRVECISNGKAKGEPFPTSILPLVSRSPPN